jgi:YVTN family beta-propeller protein
MRPTKHLRYLSIVCLVSLLEKVLFAVSTHAQQFAYVTNSSSSSVSVIDTATNSVTATIGVGARPWFRQATDPPCLAHTRSLIFIT